MRPPLFLASRWRSAIAVALAVQVLAGGCRPRHDDRSAKRTPGHQNREPNDNPPQAQSAMREAPAPSGGEIPRFAKNSPFAANYEPIVRPEKKRLWARSFLWEKAPEFIVEKWLTPTPEMRGKYVLIEYWATWCGPCRRSIPLLNEIHRRFGDRLIVIAISDEPEEAVRALEEPRIEYHVAIDTQARMKKALGVTGIPHAIILEPEGYVVWEGYPLLEGHELTTEIVERILDAKPASR